MTGQNNPSSNEGYVGNNNPSMTEYSGFQLLGHHTRGANYPCPVLPIIRLEGKLAGVFDGPELQYLSDDFKFIGHSDELNVELSEYDYRTCSLFGRAEDDILYYKVEEEDEFFLGLLSDPTLSEKDPLMMLSLAESIEDLEMVQNGVEIAMRRFMNDMPDIAWHFYRTQIHEMLYHEWSTNWAYELSKPEYLEKLISDPKILRDTIEGLIKTLEKADKRKIREVK